MAGNFFFSCINGEDFITTLTWNRPAPPADTGLPYSLAGWSASMIFDSDSGVLLTVTDTPDANGGVITLGGVAGTIGISIPAIDLSNANLDSCRYRLLLKNPSGQISCLLKGQFSLEGTS